MSGLGVRRVGIRITRALKRTLKSRIRMRRARRLPRRERIG